MYGVRFVGKVAKRFFLLLNTACDQNVNSDSDSVIEILLCIPIGANIFSSEIIWQWKMLANVSFYELFIQNLFEL